MKDDIRTRFAFIETRLLWGDGFTAAQLAEHFGLARQNAQRVVSEYRRRHPDNLQRDFKGKRQVAAPTFKPCYIHSGSAAYLDYLRGLGMTGYFMEVLDWDDLIIHDVDHLLRGRLQDEIVRELLAALREQRVVTLYYHAKSGAQMRDFSPNQLIFASNRYHIRGFCHLTCRYLDFVLSRITFIRPSASEWISSQDDVEWNSYEQLVFQPNPVLPSEAVQALELDGLPPHGDFWRITCRIALSYYIKRELLSIDHNYGAARWELKSE